MKWSGRAIQVYLALSAFASLLVAVIADWKWPH